MKYMLILVNEEGGWDQVSPEEMRETMQKWSDFEHELAAAGALIAGEGLQESETATTIRIQDSGERIVSDGPFAETKEQVGGFYLLECENLDEVLDWAKQVPMSGGHIEVRPVMDYTQFGFERPEGIAGVSS